MHFQPKGEEGPRSIILPFPYYRFKTTIKTMGDGIFKASLNIKNAQAEDSDEYTCSAENTHGLVKVSGIKVVISLPTNRTESLMQCCKNMNVKPECQGICTFNVDLDFLMFDPQCFTEFDKLMSCGSDGSDHRYVIFESLNI